MLAHLIGGWEIVLIISVVLILFSARKALDLTNARQRPRSRAHDAGRSIGGIFGKRATEALTPDNQVSELYDPQRSKNMQNIAGRVSSLASASGFANARCELFTSWVVRFDIFALLFWAYD